MALDVRMNRWGLVGFLAAASLAAALPWLSERIGDDPQVRFVLIAPILAAFAGAGALMIVRRPEAPPSVLRNEMAVPVAVQRPRWAPLVQLLPSALAGLTWAGVLGDTTFRLAFFVSLIGTALLESYWRQTSDARLTQPASH
jgi:hypothetical protein